MSQEFIQGRLVEVQRQQIEAQRDYIFFLERWLVVSAIVTTTLLIFFTLMPLPKDSNGTRQRETHPRPASQAPAAP